MPSVVAHGTARNLINDIANGVLSPNPIEKKFVTFLNEAGGVHTLIVDAEHAAKDVESLLKWFETTRGLISVASGSEGSPTHIAPAEVAAKADASIGATAEPAATEQTTPTTTETGGGY